MGMSFVQTDTAATLGEIQACSADVLASAPKSVLCVSGGTAGVTGVTPTVRHLRSTVMFEIAPGQVEWVGGTWTIPLNITSLNANCTLESAYICRRTSGGSAVSAVASDTSPSVSLGTTGVKTLNVTGVRTTGKYTDVAYIVLSVTTTGNIEVFTFMPNQTISTPIALPTRVADPTARVNQLGRLGSYV